ncbi:DJ-1/PfpI family protein [Paraflavitalea pollutisoli]|uniref:DJ-1/PfpI family protein n=1 Tax=Paraflavitalea pollutisoli TaxID=3034143 RepID=UPI0023EE1472|nr:DJ-1/PfpI family protein [Paraflavitalea sp. H1-2-19X]
MAGTQQRNHPTFVESKAMKHFINLLLVACLIVSGQPVTAQAAKAWYCMPCNSACDSIQFSQAGKCAHCEMALVEQTAAEHQRTMTNTKTRIAFYLQNGVEVLDFAGPMEVFSYAQFEVFTVSKTKDPITSQGILKILPDYSIDDAPPADIIAFFGGNAGVASSDPKVIAWLKRQPVPDYYFSVCTGAFILGKAGILDNLTITTFHESIDNLKKAVPTAKVLSNVRFVDNGKVITTAGISAGIDGALHLVAKMRGEQTARNVATYMEYDKWVPGQGLVLKRAASTAKQ